jgi:hypothetical protein
MDDPRHAFRTPLSESQQRAVFTDNAHAAYGL